ncbi:MAG: hypothetical protein AB7O76_16415 [Rhizobiaceae bacterium]
MPTGLSIASPLPKFQARSQSPWIDHFIQGISEILLTSGRCKEEYCTGAIVRVVIADRPAVVCAAETPILQVFFGVVAGSIPIAVVLPVAIFLIALIEMVGRKVRGDMKETLTKTSKEKRMKTIATKCLNYFRNLSGQALIVLAAMGTSMTAEAAGFQL